MGRARGKFQAVGSQSPEAPKSKDTNSPIPKGETPASYAQKSKRFHPGYEKSLKIKELDKKLRQKKQPEPLASVPSSPPSPPPPHTHQ